MGGSQATVLLAGRVEGGESPARSNKRLVIDNHPTCTRGSSSYSEIAALVQACVNVDELTLRVGSAGKVKTVGSTIARALAKAIKMKHFELHGITEGGYWVTQIDCTNLELSVVFKAALGGALVRHADCFVAEQLRLAVAVAGVVQVSGP